jgi:hypothetical protein
MVFKVIGLDFLGGASVENIGISPDMISVRNNFFNNHVKDWDYDCAEDVE